MNAKGVKSMAIPTTTIGACPNPPYVPAANRWRSPWVIIGDPRYQVLTEKTQVGAARPRTVTWPIFSKSNSLPAAFAVRSLTRM